MRKVKQRGMIVDQTELWDEVFQVTQSTVNFVGSLGEFSGRAVVEQELIKAATAVGRELVRANAVDTVREFEGHVKEARLKAIEADWWLRLINALQGPNEASGRALLNLIDQYGVVIKTLQRLVKQAKVAQRG